MWKVDLDPPDARKFNLQHGEDDDDDGVELLMQRKGRLLIERSCNAIINGARVDTNKCTMGWKLARRWLSGKDHLCFIWSLCLQHSTSTFGCLGAEIKDSAA